LSFDTSFLIDFQRKHRRGGGPAHQFLERHADIRLALSTVAFGEFVERFDGPDHPAVRLVAESYELLPVDRGAAVRYGAITRGLRTVGALIGTNDLWIAAVSLRHDLPLVTADEAHFGRVPGLEIVAYRR
jgi:predicted nucleic acid-binding protein